MTRDRMLAWAALAATLVIWASFLVSTRAAVATALGPVEIGLMRFAPAALLFAPVLMRRGPIPAGATWRDAAVFAVCGGILFVFLLASGMRFAPVADAGVFAPAMLPLWVAIIARFVLGERIGRAQAAGLALIVAGALAVGGWAAMVEGAPGAWRGHILFACASFNWAIYTVAFRRSRLAALPAAAMLAFWAALGFVVLAVLLGTHFSAVPVRTLVIQTLLQGVLSGFVATYTFFYAIERLGAGRTATFAAVVPILAALGAWAFLGEPLDAAKGVGVAVTAVGVALASRPRREPVG